MSHRQQQWDKATPYILRHNGSLPWKENRPRLKIVYQNRAMRTRREHGGRSIYGSTNGCCKAGGGESISYLSRNVQNCQTCHIILPLSALVSEIAACKEISSVFLL